jgi:hypothetical protein
LGDFPVEKQKNGNKKYYKQPLQDFLVEAYFFARAVVLVWIGFSNHVALYYEKQ